MDILKLVEKLNTRSGEPAGFSLVRKQGAARFSQLNWPTKKSEEWRYSPVSKFKTQFEPQAQPQDTCTFSTEKILSQNSHPTLAAIIVHNGVIQYLDPQLKGSLELFNIREALEKGFLASPNFSKIEDPLEALNFAYFEMGLFAKVPSQTVIEKPIHLIFTYSGDSQSPLFQSRLLIQAEESSSSQWIESHFDLNSTNPSWINPTTHVELKSKAHLTLIQWAELPAQAQQTHRTYSSVGSDCYFHHLQGSLSAGWSRNDFRMIATGENAQIFSHALGLSKEQGTIDQPSQLQFRGPNNKAEQICKNILFHQSRAIFNGRIHIENTAQKTDSSQLHQSLLLSQEAEVDTKPELEIYADDVKATHGATIGQLNANEVFYFQSRGIKESRAKAMLCMAFVLELCERVPNTSLQLFLKDRIETYWKKESL